jgi:hypothetical protein
LALSFLEIKLDSFWASSWLALWQPSQPIFTAAIAMLWQWGPWNRYQVLGMAISFLGCALMVLLSMTMTKNHHQQHGDEQSGGGTGITTTTTTSRTTFQHQELLGLCTSLYVLLSKQQHYTPLVVTAWSYNIAAVFMGMTALFVSSSKSTICYDTKTMLFGGSTRHVHRSHQEGRAPIREAGHSAPPVQPHNGTTLLHGSPVKSTTAPGFAPKPGSLAAALGMNIDHSTKAAPIQEVGLPAPLVQPHNGTTLLCDERKSCLAPKQITFPNVQVFF